MNKSAGFYLLYNTRNMLKTQSIFNKERTFLTFILSNHDVISPITSNYDHDVIEIMTFCSFNVIATRLICMFLHSVI